MPGTGNNVSFGRPMAEIGSNISFDTAKTVLVPAELYEKGSEGEFLNFNGMALAPYEVAVASEPVEGMVAIMGVPVAEWNLISDEYERGEAGVTSPLFRAVAGSGAGGGPTRKRREVNILLTAVNVYFAVWDNALRMAEVLPDNSTDSILYYMQVVGRRFKLRKFDIGVSGERAGLVADALRQYFGNVGVVR